MEITNVEDRIVLLKSLNELLEGFDPTFDSINLNVRGSFNNWIAFITLSREYMVRVHVEFLVNIPTQSQRVCIKVLDFETEFWLKEKSLNQDQSWVNKATPTQLIQEIRLKLLIAAIKLKEEYEDGENIWHRLIRNEFKAAAKKRLTM